MSYYLTEDLISEIFERLPPKLLLQFRSLSKSWLSRISSRNFIHRHTLQSPDKVIVRHCIDKENEDSEDIYTLNWHSCLPCPRIGPMVHMDITSVKFPVGPIGLTAIIGSCNGILCLYDIVDAQVCIYLWNFSIRRKLTLSYHPFYTDSLINGRDETFGFGFDPINDDYKVVYISYSKYGVAENTFVYSMKIDSWSEVASPTTTLLDVKSEAVFLSGVLHWLVKYNLNDHMIMTFDLTNHVFGSISLPEPSWVSYALSAYKYLYVWSEDGEKTWHWRMGEYNNVASWSPVYKCDIIQSQSHDEKACSCEIVTNWYVESLELLDKGTACGETYTHKNEKEKEKEKENSGIESTKVHMGEEKPRVVVHR